MGGCQNYGLRLGTLNIRCRIVMGIQKGTIILPTTYISSIILRGVPLLCGGLTQTVGFSFFVRRPPHLHGIGSSVAEKSRNPCRYSRTPTKEAMERIIYNTNILPITK